jgi:hypothetical protein
MKTKLSDDVKRKNTLSTKLSDEEFDKFAILVKKASLPSKSILLYKIVIDYIKSEESQDKGQAFDIEYKFPTKGKG